MVRKRKRRREEEEDAGFLEVQPAAPPQDTKLTPVDVQQKVFRLAFRGYNERDVDEFLDQVTETLASLHEENKRLRESMQEGGGRPAVAEEAERRAAAIVRQAREHAARLVEEAERRSEASVAEAPPGETPPASFLAREREFLQRLASLIQDHAKTLKDDARRAREVPAEGGEEPPGEQRAPQAGGPPGPAAEAAGGSPATPDERRTRPEAVGAAAPPAPPFAGPPVIEPAGPEPPPQPEGPPQSEAPPQPEAAVPPSQPSVPQQPAPPETAFGPAVEDDEATLPWHPEGAAWPAGGASENDPLLSAWESAFIPGQEPESFPTGGTSPSNDAEGARLEDAAPTSEGTRLEDAPPAEDDERRRTEEEPSLRELFWGEE